MTEPQPPAPSSAHPLPPTPAAPIQQALISTDQ
jgi:hypothetical protein